MGWYINAKLLGLYTAWLEGRAELQPIAAVKGLAENLHQQDKAPQTMKDLRHAQGALSLETIEAIPIFEGDSIRDLQVEEKNRAKDIIEDFMIAANGVTVRYLSSKKKLPPSAGWSGFQNDGIE